MPENKNPRDVTDTDRQHSRMGSKSADSATIDRERIAQRAYERFQARGAEHGHDQEDWFEAEREGKES